MRQSRVVDLQTVFTFEPNSPPSAPKAGRAVSFNGGSSTDMGSTITGWEWTFDPLPTGPTSVPELE